MSREAAKVLAEEVTRDPGLLLGLATGGTPTRAYELFVDARRVRGPADQLRVVKLDEWGGLAMDDPATCETYIRRRIVGPLGIDDRRFIGWTSDPTDPEAECRRIAGLLHEAGPMDVCVLGLGVNGHLAFNEPGETLLPWPHVATLAESSMGHAMLSDARGRPTYGLTLGMADILAARRILLLVSGAAKAAAMERLAEEHISPRFPASFLWLHADVTVLCDSAAAEGLRGTPLGDETIRRRSETSRD